MKLRSARVAISYIACICFVASTANVSASNARLKNPEKNSLTKKRPTKMELYYKTCIALDNVTVTYRDNFNDLTIGNMFDPSERRAPAFSSVIKTKVSNNCEDVVSFPEMKCQGGEDFVLIPFSLNSNESGYLKNDRYDSFDLSDIKTYADFIREYRCS